MSHRFGVVLSGLPTRYVHRIFGLLLALGVVAHAGVAEATTLETSLKGTDLEGESHHFPDATNSTAAVFVFLSIDCPISNGYLPELNRLAQRYRSNGVEFYGVISDRLVSRAAAVRHSDEFQVRFPVLFDASCALQRQLGPTHTPHAFVVNSQREVMYEGAIDDTYAKLGERRQRASAPYLRDAILAVVSGRPQPVKSTTPVGCHMEAPTASAATAAVTYSRDIAPIINANCTECHRPDQAAPFALQTYEDVSRHARQIVEVTRSQFMPPWKPAADFGHFRNERRLTEAEIALLEVWASSGKAEGPANDLPAEQVFVDGWQLGEPDLILEMNDAFEVPAEGADIHQYFVLPTRLRKDRLVAAVEFRPGARRVVHHAAFFLDTHGRGRELDAADPGSGYRGFGSPGFEHQGTLRSWLPGMTPRRLPEGTGRLIPRNSDIVVEVHYHCRGTIEHDQFQVGIYYAPLSARQPVVEMQVLNKELKIPAGASRHHHQASYVLPVDTTLLDVVPHMHLLGREMKVTATLPGGETRDLVWVKDWDFNWQSQYTYVEPISLPRGTRLQVDAWYDNSADNALNPSSPPVDVYWGIESTDEMDICHFHCTCRSLPEIKALLADLDRFTLEQYERQRQTRRR